MTRSISRYPQLCHKTTQGRDQQANVPKCLHHANISTIHPQSVRSVHSAPLESKVGLCLFSITLQPGKHTPDNTHNWVGIMWKGEEDVGYLGGPNSKVRPRHSQPEILALHANTGAIG